MSSRQVFFGRCSALLLLAAVVSWSSAGEASEPPRGGARALLDKYAAIKGKLDKNQFGAPVYLESAEAEGSLRVDMYGIFQPGAKNLPPPPAGEGRGGEEGPVLCIRPPGGAKKPPPQRPNSPAKRRICRTWSAGSNSEPMQHPTSSDRTDGQTTPWPLATGALPATAPV